MPLSHLGHSLLEEGRVSEAELSLVRALRLAEQSFGEYDVRVGVATCALARIKAAPGEVDEFVSLYHKGLQIMEGCSKFADKSEEAQELWEENLRVKERIVGSDEPQLDDEAEPLACQALKLRECSFGSNSATVGEVCICLASIGFNTFTGKE
ncbi:unnamed protein product [Sphagnum jensenii]|uniref:Uncharacterized protein n=1 Tax=Sphagnum jensenii TaxID=128206 RepID=A0ABP1BF32_9BRYO